MICRHQHDYLIVHMYKRFQKRYHLVVYDIVTLDQRLTKISHTLFPRFEII